MIVTPTQPASQTLASAANAKSTAGADFNMFLKLLTTQMQNQDPLDPMKASEYTQQLAQYTQIEQTVQQSGTLKEILSRLSSQDVAQASGLIGRDAIFASATAGLGAGPATWTYDLPAAGRNIVASIANSSGKVVATRSLADGTGGGFAWDGMLSNGTRAADGAYQLSIAATDAAGKTLPATISSTGRVSEVTMVNGMPALGINGVALPVSALIKVAAASS
jgi:flagellar basal-body rod modification protein FlgD